MDTSSSSPAPTVDTPTRRELLVVALLSLAVVPMALGTGLPAEDDAFVYLRYVVHWVSGLGLTFNPGEHVEGFSSPLWMAILGASGSVGLTPHIAGRAMSLGLTVLLIWAAHRLALVAGCSAAARLGVVVCLTFNFWLLVWGQGGLETALYGSALTLATASVLRLAANPRPRAAVLAGGLLAATALSRPEGVLLGIIALPWLARQGVRGSLWRLLALIFAAPVLLYMFWRRFYFDAWLPNTSVKIYPLHFDRSVPQATQFAVFLGGLSVLLAVLGASKLGNRATRLCVGAGLALSPGFHFLAGGDYRPGFRYLMPALPLLFVAAWGTLERLPFPGSKVLQHAAGVVLAVSCLIGSLIAWRTDGWRSSSLSVVAERWRDPWADPSQGGVAESLWLLQNAPAGAVVAYGQMGRAPYLAALSRHPIRFIDTVGWVDRPIADLYRFDHKVVTLCRRLANGESWSVALEHDRAERASRFVDLMLERRPDFVLLEPYLVHAGTALLQRDPRFLTLYARVLEFGPTPGTVVFRRRAVPAPERSPGSGATVRQKVEGSAWRTTRSADSLASP